MYDERKFASATDWTIPVIHYCWSNLVKTTRLIDFFSFKRCQKFVNIIERKSEMADWLIM